MTEDRARTLANVLIAAAVIGAGYYIVRTPPLRRSAWQLARTAIGGAVPWLISEAQRAWQQADQPSNRDVMDVAHSSGPQHAI